MQLATLVGSTTTVAGPSPVAVGAGGRDRAVGSSRCSENVGGRDQR